MSQNPLYLDVRTREEHAQESIEPSVNIPVDELSERLAALGARNRPIIVYCRSGRRSAIALDILRAAGFTNVRDAGSIYDVRAA
jgi:phage shock protein E